MKTYSLCCVYCLLGPLPPALDFIHELTEWLGLEGTVKIMAMGRDTIH